MECSPGIFILLKGVKNKCGSVLGGWGRTKQTILVGSSLLGVFAVSVAVLDVRVEKD